MWFQEIDMHMGSNRSSLYMHLDLKLTSLIVILITTFLFVNVFAPGGVIGQVVDNTQNSGSSVETFPMIKYCTILLGIDRPVNWYVYNRVNDPYDYYTHPSVEFRDPINSKYMKILVTTSFDFLGLGGTGGNNFQSLNDLKSVAGKYIADKESKGFNVTTAENIALGEGIDVRPAYTVHLTGGNQEIFTGFVGDPSVANRYYTIEYIGSTDVPGLLDHYKPIITEMINSAADCGQ